ncbi:hypothetical protein QVD17_14074 [Tagetes erecta]|uniref:Ubiquitin-like domain-containing protein n=1 Tax=Tagetes erecta TaxID=13708 RepID=A0AAD8P3L3_TARER|nr:hypothetical protein QVD17_14074 [Tagetes erecta]
MSTLNNVEHKKPVTDDQETRITLKVINQDGIEVFFRMKRSTMLQRLINAYCVRHYMNPSRVTFLFDRRLIRGDETPDEMEMEQGDAMFAILHQTEERKICFDEGIAKEIAREEELYWKEQEVLFNKMQAILWRIGSKLIAQNSVLKEELTKLKEDEEDDVVLIKVGRIVCELMAENSGLKEELVRELTRLEDEWEDDKEDDEGGEEKDDDTFLEIGRLAFELVGWAKKNQVLHSRL